jgi:thermitase
MSVRPPVFDIAHVADVMSPRITHALSLGAIVAGLLMAAPAQAATDQTVLVKFKPGAASTATSALLGTAANKVGAINALGVTVVKTTGSASALVSKLNASGLVEYAELDKTMKITATPNDPRYTELYGLNNTGQTGGTSDADIDAPEAWDAAGLGAFPATGGVKVGIVDTGIRATHQDLSGKVANCAQAYSSIPILAPTLREGSCTDDNGHGSHVAGTIAAKANNGVGVTGVAFNSPLAICKALGGPLGSGSTTGVANCITYLADKGAKVISMSLGGGASSTLESAVNYAVSKDVLLIAAAGNDGDATLNYPAAYANVVSVAATDNKDARASFSNANSDVEVAAPGVDVLSSYNSSDSAYEVLSGTSMATPHVAGVAAIIRGKNAAFTWSQARTKLDGSVDDLGSAGRDANFGFGRVNLVKAAS